MMKTNQEPLAGPSRETGVCSSDDESIDDEEKCCVCNLFTPQEVSGATSLIFTKWAQCYGVRNGRPCLHWTHLSYCTNARVVRRQEKFFCSHCIEE
ncbi:hypothetical protein DPMN_186263 [Dreissena polymorpha]|uniref:Uncharacterized protein n=1 Tax=Dreissena polymorpha TaxID=45954 RepID=A0A9D4DLZ1_DREPO|nr:hypothetical protein DPMN_186263 [Dreissena polymorpha]